MKKKTEPLLGNRLPNGPFEGWDVPAALKTTAHEDTTLQRMRWFLLILVAISFLASTTIGIIAFLVTKNLYTLAIIPTPTLLIQPAARALLPLDTRRFYLAALNLQSQRSKKNAFPPEPPP